MNKWMWVGILASVLGTSAAQAAPVTYNLGGGGALQVLVKYDRNALIAGHDHVLASSQYSGTATWDTDNIGGCNVKITMPVTSLQVDPPGARSSHGIEGTTPDGDRPKILKNALGKSQLNSSSYANITFQSTSCAASGDKVTVNGNFSMAGGTKPIAASMKVMADSTSFKANGGFKTTHTTFGFSPFTALLGSLRNDDNLAFRLDVRGTPQ